MFLKYILQGIAVSIGYYFIKNKNTKNDELLKIFLISMTLSFLVDNYNFFQVNENFTSNNLDRNSGQLYSGDIINIYNEDKSKSLQRSKISSEIKFDKPIKNVITNLTRLRFSLPNHRLNEQQPIKFGDEVYIMHNANVESINRNRYIKMSDVLHSHHKGPGFKKFILINPENIEDNNSIKYNDKIVIKNIKSGNTVESGFLIINEDDTISNSTQDVNEATKFNLELKRVFETNNRHLCINPGETLYP